MYRLLSLLLLASFAIAQKRCDVPSVTTVSGLLAPADICPGDLIFQDEFDFLDHKKWRHENTLAGGGNWEFQWYQNNRSNSFVREGVLYIKPTLLADQMGEDFLFSGNLNIHGGAPADECTNPQWWGCDRTGSAESALNPIKSARLRTLESFSYKYGRLEARAKLPSGDWLWPAIWMMPRYNAYGSWPASGEIDIMESRGNRDYVQNGQQIGAQLVSSTLHWGPDWSRNGYPTTHWEKNNAAGYDGDFHTYEIVWSPTSMDFYVDGERTGGVSPPAGGFWELGGWGNSGLANPWEGESAMAPFDHEFYIMLNNACGGVAFFPDDAVNAGGKPWLNNAAYASTDFWRGRTQWLPTWTLDQNDNAALQVDYVRVYAL